MATTDGADRTVGYFAERPRCVSRGAQYLLATFVAAVLAVIILSFIASRSRERTLEGYQWLEHSAGSEINALRITSGGARVANVTDSEFLECINSAFRQRHLVTPWYGKSQIVFELRDGREFEYTLFVWRTDGGTSGAWHMAIGEMETDMPRAYELPLPAELPKRLESILEDLYRQNH